jgi:hypothetical protein
MSDTYADFELAQLIISRFGSLIRTLIFHSVYYPPVSLDVFRIWMPLDLQTSCECYDDRVKYAYAQYQESRAERQVITNHGELLAHVCVALSKMQRLSKLYITLDTRSKGRGENPRSFYCSKAGCNLEDKSHLFIEKPGHQHGIKHSSAMHWDTLILALSVTKTKLKEITSDSDWNEDSYSINAFVMTRQRALHLANAFQGLKKLRLTISQCKTGYEVPDRSSGYRGDLATALSTASNVEYLDIKLKSNEHYEVESKPDGGTYFGGILGPCRLPRLRSFRLDFVESTEAELLGFLDASPDLEYLQLKHYALVEGMWEPIADKLKALPKLKKVRLGDFPEDLWHKSVFRQRGSFCLGRFEEGLVKPFASISLGNSQKIVDDFFKTNGKNPFSREALEAIQMKNEALEELRDDVSSSESSTDEEITEEEPINLAATEESDAQEEHD